MLDVHDAFAEFFNNEQIVPYARLLSSRMEEGHICIDPADADINTNRAGKTEQILQQIPSLVSDRPDVIRPFVLHQNRLYLHRYFHYETDILESVRLLIRREPDFLKQRIEELRSMRGLIDSFRDDTGAEPGEPTDLYTDWQLAAAISAYLNHFTIITGGPGTGKTTSVAKVLSLLLSKNPELSIAIAAPTGKAAVRVGESLKKTRLQIPDDIRHRLNQFQPTTLHKLLGFQYDSIYFKYNKANQLPYDVIVVDEASMIDVAMFSKLITSVRHDARLIFLGDKNQLASVEAGSLFGDLCRLQQPSNRFDAKRIDLINEFLHKQELKIQPAHLADASTPLINHIVELRRSRRFEHNSKIGQLSRSILENDQVVLTDLLEQNTFDAAHPVFQPSAPQDQIKDVVMFDAENSDELFEQFIAGYAAYIQSPTIEDALKAINRLRILCVVREGNRGIYQINKKTEQLLKQRGIRNQDGSLFNPDKEFYENRPVIVTRNLPDLKLSNGDVGIMRKDPDGYMKVWFETPEGPARAVPAAYIGGLETVFAMTIHKSQGSEYNNILLVLPEQEDHKLLSAELIYTGVTRAIDNVFLQSSASVIQAASAIRVRRSSGIMQRINEIN